RVGLTKFAARVLGDVVDIGFEAPSGTEVPLGGNVGWFAGFKARSGLYTVVRGTFGAGKPAVGEGVEGRDRARYRTGWLEGARGVAEPAACDAAGYAAILDATIDRMRGKMPQEQR